MESLEYSYVIALLCKVACAGKTRRTRADNSSLVTVGSGLLCGSLRLSVMPVSYKALQSADSDGLALFASYALALALCLLRAYSAADSRK